MLRRKITLKNLTNEILDVLINVSLKDIFFSVYVHN